MKKFTLEIPDFYENGGIEITLMTAVKDGMTATIGIMDLQKNQEMYVTDKNELRVRDLDTEVEQMYIEEAIERLEQMKNLYDTGEMAEALEMAIEALRREWTPVTEALPEFEGMYLVTVEDDQGKRSMKTSSFIFTTSGDAWIIETSPMYTVKAWAELPPMWEG